MTKVLFAAGEMSLQINMIDTTRVAAIMNTAVPRTAATLPTHLNTVRAFDAFFSGLSLLMVVVETAGTERLMVVGFAGLASGAGLAATGEFAGLASGAGLAVAAGFAGLASGAGLTVAAGFAGLVSGAGLAATEGFTGLASGVGLATVVELTGFTAGAV